MNWRNKVINRLDQISEYIKTNLNDDELNDLINFTKKDEKKIEIIENNISNTLYLNKELLKASVSSLYIINSSQIPYHFQIIVPSAKGTASLNSRESYEIAVWERSLLTIFYQLDLSVIMFEFSSNPPLIIDIFPIPFDEKSIFYWKNAFEEYIDDSNSQIIKLKTRSLKGIFPLNLPYIAVSFENGEGLGLIWNGSFEPRKLAIQIISLIWKSNKQNPPEDLENIILNYKNWPK